MTRLLHAVVLGIVLALPACAGQVGTDGTSPEPTTPGTPRTTDPTPPLSPPPTPATPPGSASPVDPLSDPPLAGAARGSETLTGVVVAGVEAGCLLLETGSATLLLVGAPADVARVGARIRVTGAREPGLMTTCQQGVPFRVREVRPAG